MLSFPLGPIEQPGRVPIPPELYFCLAQLLPPVASPPALELLPFVVPLLGVLRLWNIQLRSTARQLLDVDQPAGDDGQTKRRLKMLGRQKAQDALELKLHGFGVMVGLWRIQTAILAGTTAKAALQPLIDDYFPPLPLPDYFLASECFKLDPARRREIEATVQRTRKTCQAFRKRAAVVANAYTGPPEGLRAALIAAKITDGPISLEPADFEGPEGTARALLTQAANVRSLWDELTGLVPPPLPAAVSSSPRALSAKTGQPLTSVDQPPTPAQALSSQESIVEDSQKSSPTRKPLQASTSPARRSSGRPSVPLVSEPVGAVENGGALEKLSLTARLHSGLVALPVSSPSKPRAATTLGTHFSDAPLAARPAQSPAAAATSELGVPSPVKSRLTSPELSSQPSRSRPNTSIPSDIPSDARHSSPKSAQDADPQPQAIALQAPVAVPTQKRRVTSYVDAGGRDDPRSIVSARHSSASTGTGRVTVFVDAGGGSGSMRSILSAGPSSRSTWTNGGGGGSRRTDLFDPPSRKPPPQSTVAPASARPGSSALKRALNRTSGRGAFDSSSDDDDSDNDESLLPLRKQARRSTAAGGSKKVSEPAAKATARPSAVGSAVSPESRASSTTDSSLGYVELPSGTVPRPANWPPAAAARDVGTGQVRGELRRN